MFYLYSAEDLRLLLQGKRLLARVKLGRRYDRKAVEVLQIIQVSCMIAFRRERALKLSYLASVW